VGVLEVLGEVPVIRVAVVAADLVERNHRLKVALREVLREVRVRAMALPLV